jgi:hypothetical protein
MDPHVRISFLRFLANFPLWMLPAAAMAQEAGSLSQPVYRVAKTPSQEPVTADVAPQTGQPPFDLEARPGEHPLWPALRVAKLGLEEIDSNIQDYSCTLVKRERIQGVLMEQQFAFVKVRHRPFSVYMFFLKPKKGQEVLYVEGQNDGDLLAMAHDWRRKLGAVALDPTGSMAMDEQKYPVTKLGIRNLTAELIQVAENDVQYGECEFKYSYNAKVNGRPCTKLEVIHPVPRKNFRFHIAKIYIDNELRVPICYQSWMWPKAGEEPPLEEEYYYMDLKLNNGYTDQTFSKDNPDIFKR